MKLSTTAKEAVADVQVEISQERLLSRFFACSSGRSTDGSCGSFMETLWQQIVMLEAALQEAAGAAGVTLTVENGAILITPPP